METVAPFVGLTVVEFANWAAAPSAGMLLAEHGATVIKIEPLTGDSMRKVIQQASVDADIDHPFQFANRGKKAVALALNEPRGQDIAHQLAATADVILCNLLPSRRERMRLTVPELRETNPTAVIGVLTGYGDQGPDADRAGYDITAFYAGTGLSSACADETGVPPRWRPATGDFTAGLSLYAGVVTALVERARTGEGQLVETSLLRAGAWTNAWDLTRSAADGRPSRSKGREGTHNPLVESFRCADDRWVQLALANPVRAWPALCDAIERPDMVESPKFATPTLRRKNAAELVAILGDEIASRFTGQQLVDALAARGEASALILHSNEVVTDEQVLAAGVLGTVRHPDGDLTVVRPPFDVTDGNSEGSGTDPDPGDAYPEPGSDTRTVLSESLGLSTEDLDTLAEAGVIGV